MEVAKSIVKALSGLVDGRVNPTVLPQDEELPAIRYIQVGGQVNRTICGGDNQDDDVPRFQIDIYSKDTAELMALEKAVRQQMASIKGSIQNVPVHSYSSELKAHESILDYLFF